MIGTNDYWIVRCDPRSTLINVEALRGMGFKVWAPTVEREYRRARSKKYIRVVEALLPSFIFVETGDNPIQCAERLDDLRYEYGIRVYRTNGAYSGTSSESLDGLRAVEADANTFGIDNLLPPDNFELGQIGSINALSFMGLTCTLVGRSGKNLIVLMENSITPITVKPAFFRPL